MIYAHIHEFLSDVDHRELRASALDQTFHTKDPRGGPDDGDRPGLRAAGICFDWDGFTRFHELAGTAIEEWVEKIDASIMPGHPHWPNDVQLTRTGDGGFFGVHKDAEYPGVTGGIVSYVYYLGDQATFTGGELEFVNGTVVKPVDNSLVIFPGTEPHQVLPVSGATAIRLTINGYYGISS